ncbi:MAG TPA: pitrilysin family protein [Puia sp.]|nr:pitrilysin family protein [Puia sp.]
MDRKTKEEFMLNRTIAPKITDAIGFNLKLPPSEKHKLKNGVEVYAIDLGELDTLMINWIFDAGNFYEEKNLVANAANYLLKNGTSKKNAFEINEHFEYYGSFLNRACQNEFADISLHCLGKHVNHLLPVVAEMLTDSVFPQEELDIFSKNMQQRLLVGLKKSEFVAGRLIDAYLFGENHPYGKMSSAEDYAALKQDEIKIFYEKYYKHGSCVIFVAGKLPKDIIQQLDNNFGSLPLRQRSASSIKNHHIIPAKEKKYNVVNDVNGVQGSIRIARNFPNRHHPDFSKMQVLNNLFGGFFGSRLMSNIREDKGYTYGIHSYLMNHIEQSAFLISTEAGKEVCAATIDEVYKEMKLLCEELIDEEELSQTRNFMIGIILGDLDGPFQVAARWKNIVLNNLDEQYFYKGIDIIKTITAKELQELADKYFQPGEFYELVVV